MKKTAVWIFLTAGLFCSGARADTIVVETPKAVPVSFDMTAGETVRDFLRREESRVCSEMRQFALENFFNKEAFMAAADERDTRAVAAAASGAAKGLAKDYDVDFVFYHPNTRFFVRVNDKNYRGRMRIPAVNSSACYWERLPSQDVVYSVLMKIDGGNRGYLKLSKRLTRMTGNLPDVLAPYGKAHVYAALDKTGLKKMAWFKMRRREPNKMHKAGWCTMENLAFLSHIGYGDPVVPKKQKKLLSLIDENEEFEWPEADLSGGSVPIYDLDGERLAAVIYTLSPFPGEQTADEKLAVPAEENSMCSEEESGCFEAESAQKEI